MTSVLHTEYRDRIALLELHRPQARNAIDLEMRQALTEELAAIARRPDIGAVVLCGAGKGFCAGADLKSSKGSDTTLRSAARMVIHDFNPLLETIVRMDKPVIAAVNGSAAGFGMSLALACDLLVMAEDAFLLSNFINVGLVPDGGAAWLLLRRLGYGRTFEVLADGKPLDARRCLDEGIANRVVAPDELRETALQWAAELAARAPMALALTKRLARLSQEISLADAMTLEGELQTLCMATEDSREAIKAFVEKRPPKFTGR
jgi:2-(1,2-epoxy-1,2-dihydrophenyl)acetyl-CoA isomerase